MSASKAAIKLGADQRVNLPQLLATVSATLSVGPTALGADPTDAIELQMTCLALNAIRDNLLEEFHAVLRQQLYGMVVEGADATELMEILREQPFMWAYVRTRWSVVRNVIQNGFVSKVISEVCPGRNPKVEHWNALSAVLGPLQLEDLLPQTFIDQMDEAIADAPVVTRSSTLDAFGRQLANAREVWAKFDKLSEDDRC